MSSGAIVNAAYGYMIGGKGINVRKALWLTIGLGLGFTGIQTYEYFHLSFSINDGAFGSAFFLLTGVHGLHVLVGTVILVLALVRRYQNHFSTSRHFGFQVAM